MASGGTLTDLTNAVVKSSIKTLNGQVMTRPALVVGDGKNQIYACDVNVGIPSAPGRQDQATRYLFGVPGTRHYQANDSFTIGTILRNVPIANNNSNLRYADVGNSVIVTRNDSGQWQVTGFSVELPGTRTRYAVDLSNMVLGPITDTTVSARPLTLGELSTLGQFGITPLGSTGIFYGGVLQEISS